VFCHTAIENLSDPIGNLHLNNVNRKITNDLELPQYRRQSDTAADEMLKKKKWR
jgi:hypothetical protein